jgi:purine-nucleoside phosphorylase
MEIPPILKNKYYGDKSIFDPNALIREARRQKGLDQGVVPRFCVLDPDGDLSRHLQDLGAPKNYSWACYHTEMRDLQIGEDAIGVVGCAVGASFAVLVAEQLFASGCKFLLSVTSAGRLGQDRSPPYFQLIDRSFRDEGTSYHYLPPSDFVFLSANLENLAKDIMDACPGVIRGGAWTTDAPYRETAKAAEKMREHGLLAVEMESAALYAYAQVSKRDVLCFAHITNQMAVNEIDFEKGDNNGNTAMIELIQKVYKLLVKKDLG